MWFTIIAIVGAIIVGVIAHKSSGENDSATEQMAETVLEAQGIHIDFSEDDKKKEK